MKIKLGLLKMDPKIKKLCSIIGRDLAKLHKGDTVSALFPFIPNEAEFYVGGPFINHLYKIIKLAKEKGLSKREIALLFEYPSKVAQYFVLFHSTKSLEIEKRNELALDMLNIIENFREDPFCENGKNKLKEIKIDIEFNEGSEYSKQASKLSGLLLLYLEIIFPTMMRVGHEFHGDYLKEGEKIFIKEFYNLSTQSLNMECQFPFRNIKIYEKIEGQVNLDFFNHLFTKPRRLSSKVIIDGKVQDKETLFKNIKVVEEKVQFIAEKCSTFTKKDWFKVYSRGLFESTKKISEKLNIKYSLDKIYKKIKEEDFSIPLKKIIEFNKIHSQEEIEEITKDSFLKIFEENEKEEKSRG